jgi:hypothetical protein
MKKIIILLIPAWLLLSCNKTNESKNNDTNKTMISTQTQTNVISELTKKFGNEVKSQAEKGISQAASLWLVSDGSEDDFKKFCTENFAGTADARKLLFEKLQRNFEILNGYFNRITLDLQEPVQLDEGELIPVDDIFAGYDSRAHLYEDLFANKAAFVTILNFPAMTLEEKTENSDKMSRLDWAYARMGDVFTSRVPSEINQKLAQSMSAADTYISNYNIFMGNLANDKGEKLFPSDMKLISHWGLRDELKSNYNDKEHGLEKQQMIYEVMKNIIAQKIPQTVINSNKYQWNPTSDKLLDNGKEIPFEAEQNTRYQTLLNLFQNQKAYDAYDPIYKNYIDRKFSSEMEIPLTDIEKLFAELLSSPEVKKTAELIKKRLGRNLEPFDIWYNGFKSSKGMPETELDKITKAKYPNPEAFHKDMPNMLKNLGFSPEKAEYISAKIKVDPARGSGHAWGAQMKSDFAHLRTRIAKDGMNYKGYNIAVHEFGHNVEQTLSLYDVDYYMLNGVPNTAFTEALAFVFQNRDMQLLGFENRDSEKEYLEDLDIFWSCYEIMGVSLVDQGVWKWMYAHPDATPESLKQAVNEIAVDVWNKYYADVFGIKDQPILAIYSHMIDDPLYLSAYPVGYLIKFQLEKQFAEKGFAPEVQRIFTLGRLTPQAWMKAATGNPISNRPLLESVDKALEKILK